MVSKKSPVSWNDLHSFNNLLVEYIYNMCAWHSTRLPMSEGTRGEGGVQLGSIKN